MCKAFKCAVYLVICSSYFIGLHAAEEQTLQLKNCTKQDECPDRSICTKVVADLNCVCWQGYHQNPNWSLQIINSTQAEYCLRESATTSRERMPAKPEYVAVAIVLILLGVIVVTLIFYCFITLRPIKRTQAAYRRLQLKRSNHRHLEEFNDIDMTFRDARELS
ncbi:uncharacterized protein LOC116805784 [Drosophila grimshawi]|uniref:uncharacterized protein LOC116805784 n=1 Tax=Drosophila grimshawi TaxID=7222 RepID=UPI000C86FF6F|nr:uncharacterized protein LOC116805784 [Drosophila grimshawi]